MSRAFDIIETLRSTLAAVDETCSPAEADAIYGAVISHVRSRRPESVAPLGILPPPSEPIRDPRAVGDATR